MPSLDPAQTWSP